MHKVFKNITPFPLLTPKFNPRNLYIITLMSEIGLSDSSEIHYDNHKAVATKLREKNGLEQPCK